MSCRNPKITSWRFLVASKAMHLRHAQQNYRELIERLFNTAFKFSKDAYRHDSLCGWAPWLYQPPLAEICDDIDLEDRKPSPVEEMDGVVIHETPNGIILEIEVPHLKAESLYLEVSGNMLIVRGERLPGAPSKQRSNSKTLEALNFERLIVLPIQARPGEIRAKLVGRVVRVNILKR
jgi:HSP20 family molecular chaperone IbpA